MTKLQKDLIDCLLQGMYLMQRIRNNGDKAYKLYRGNMVPVRYYTETTIRSISSSTPFDLFKKDKRCRLTLHLGNVRRLHGRCWIKQRYKTFNNKKSS
jgi:hypothetical protein